MDRNEIHVGRWFSRKSGVDRSTSSLDGLCQAPEYISRSLMCAKTSVSSIMMRLPIYRGVPTTARCGRKVCQFCLLKGLMRILRKWLLKTRHVPRIVLMVLPLRWNHTWFIIWPSLLPMAIVEIMYINSKVVYVKQTAIKELRHIIC